MQLGMVAKCSPPLRPRAEVDDLWGTVLDGLVDLVGSDHSPSPPELKQGDDAFAAWGGIAGCQTLLRVCSARARHAGSRSNGSPRWPQLRPRGGSTSRARDRSTLEQMQISPSSISATRPPCERTSCSHATG